MRNLTLATLAVLMVTACSSNNYGGGGSGYGGAGGSYGANAHFLAGNPTVIEVTLRDPLPVARAFLVDPTGIETAAYDIQRDRQVYHSNGGPRPSVGVGVFGGSSGHIGTGIGIGVPIYSSGDGYSGEITDSTAKVKIADPVLYRSTWQQWKLRLELDDGRNSRTVEVVPPTPQ